MARLLDMQQPVLFAVDLIAMLLLHGPLFTIDNQYY
jgi:hypothetical protein